MPSLSLAFAEALAELEDNEYQQALDLWRIIESKGTPQRHLNAVVAVAKTSGAQAAMNVARLIDDGALDETIEMMAGLLR